MPLKTTILQVRLAVDMAPHWHHTSGDVARQALACATAAALPAGSSSLRRAISASRSWLWWTEASETPKLPKISKCGKPWACSCAFRAAISSSWRLEGAELKAHTQKFPFIEANRHDYTPNCPSMISWFLVYNWRNIMWPTHLICKYQESNGFRPHQVASWVSSKSVGEITKLTFHEAFMPFSRILFEICVLDAWSFTII